MLRATCSSSSSGMISSNTAAASAAAATERSARSGPLQHWTAPKREEVPHPPAPAQGVTTLLGAGRYTLLPPPPAAKPEAGTPLPAAAPSGSAEEQDPQQRRQQQQQKCQPRYKPRPSLSRDVAVGSSRLGKPSVRLTRLLTSGLRHARCDGRVRHSSFIFFYPLVPPASRLRQARCIWLGECAQLRAHPVARGCVTCSAFGLFSSAVRVPSIGVACS